MKSFENSFDLADFVASAQGIAVWRLPSHREALAASGGAGITVMQAAD